LAELDDEIRLLPLYSIVAIQAAFALGGPARQTHRLHFEIMRKTSEALTSHPFAGQGWAEELLPDTRTNASVARHPNAEPLVAWRHRQGFREQSEALQEVLSDSSNPAWEFIDREKALTAVVAVDSIGRRSRRELYGAVTAALWLGDVDA
jgi:hypothetical protein